VAPTGPEQLVTALHAADPTARQLGIELVEAAAGRVTVSLRVGPDHVNGHGICHGGVLFSLVDTACTLAAQSRGRTARATGATIELLKAAPLGAELIADCAEIHAQGRGGVHDVVVSTPDGTVIALARGRTRVVDPPAAQADG
jgi:acyl-CoA thioesterase